MRAPLYKVRAFIKLLRLVEGAHAAIDTPSSSTMSVETIKKQYPDLYRQIWERGLKAAKRQESEKRSLDLIRRVLDSQHSHTTGF